jgi:hypothetical protein
MRLPRGLTNPIVQTAMSPPLEQRRNPRFRFVRRIVLQAVDAPEQTYGAHAQDISLDGLYVRAMWHWPVGTRLKIFLEADDQVLYLSDALVGRVRWPRIAMSRDRLPGFCVTFVDPPAKAKALLRALESLLQPLNTSVGTLVGPIRPETTNAEA